MRAATLFARRPGAAVAAILALTTLPAQAQKTDGQAVLTVRMTGFRSDRGRVMLALFASQNGFPNQVGRACRVASAPIKNGQAKVVLDRLPSGTYAVSVFHDENGNGKMDTDWLGRPREGHGASNNVPSKRSAPKFVDARFTVTAPRTEISIKIVYP